MKPALVDISVLLLFHARPDHFGKVWAEVRKARPKRLFLFQDGPTACGKGRHTCDGHPPVKGPAGHRGMPPYGGRHDDRLGL